MNTLGTKLWSLARKVVYTTRYMIILFCLWTAKFLTDLWAWPSTHHPSIAREAALLGAFEWLGLSKAWPQLQQPPHPPLHISILKAFDLPTPPLLAPGVTELLEPVNQHRANFQVKRCIFKNMYIDIFSLPHTWKDRPVLNIRTSTNSKYWSIDHRDSTTPSA